MPTITRWYIKTSLAYLVAALLVGALLAARPWWSPPALLGGLTPVYFHLFMVGWVTQLIFGVVFWLFPKYSKEQPRGHEWLAWVTYALLNTGLLLRAVSEPLNAQQPGAVWGWLLALSALLQWLAAIGFITNTWPRVHGGPRRKKQGE